MPTKRTHKSSSESARGKKLSEKHTLPKKSLENKNKKPPRKVNRRDTIAALIMGDVSSTIARAHPSFYTKVYELVEQIPRGKVTTYGAIAETLGMKGSSRMVGHALNAISEGHDLPAQRVINRIGALSGAHHFGGYESMRRLLLREGITFRKELVNMELHFWHPKELLKK